MFERASIARWLSRVFHPLIISPVTLSWLVFRTTSSYRQTIWWTGLALLIVIFPVAIWIGYNKRAGRYSSWSVSIRSHRRSLYIFGLVCLMLLIVALHVWDGPQIAIASLYAAALAAALSALANQFITKISLHSMALVGCATALLLAGDLVTSGVYLMILFPMGWSRIYLGEHSGLQLALGAVIGAASVFLIFPIAYT